MIIQKEKVLADEFSFAQIDTLRSRISMTMKLAVLLIGEEKSKTWCSNISGLEENLVSTVKDQDFIDLVFHIYSYFPHYGENPSSLVNSVFRYLTDHMVHYKFAKALIAQGGPKSNRMLEGVKNGFKL